MTQNLEQIQLFCLPFAGANFYSYIGLSDSLNAHINYSPIELPGHGKRFGENPLIDINKMSDDIYNQIKIKLNAPFAIYCHSMGALLGYLILLKLIEIQCNPPIHFFVSGWPGPPFQNNEKPLSALPDEIFIKKLIEYGGVPKEFLKEQELINLFLPILRADFKAFEKYKYAKSDEIMDIPVTIMLGDSDVFLSYENALTWQNITTKKIDIHQFSGGHFFIFDNWVEIAKIINNAL